MSAKLTSWFAAGVKPTHVGVYERKSGTCGKFWYWNGLYWETGGWERAEDAVTHPRSKSAVSHLEWRGLAEKP